MFRLPTRQTPLDQTAISCCPISIGQIPDDTLKVSSGEMGRRATKGWSAMPWSTTLYFVQCCPTAATYNQRPLHSARLFLSMFSPSLSLLLPRFQEYLHHGSNLHWFSVAVWYKRSLNLLNHSFHTLYPQHQLTLIPPTRQSIWHLKSPPSPKSRDPACVVRAM
jgi:hypothetical protein